MGNDGQSRFNEKAGGPVKVLQENQEGWPKAGLVIRSKWFSFIPMNE